MEPHVRRLFEDREPLEDVEALRLPLGLREERLDVAAGLEERRIRDGRYHENTEK